MPWAWCRVGGLERRAGSCLSNERMSLAAAEMWGLWAGQLLWARRSFLGLLTGETHAGEMKRRLRLESGVGLEVGTEDRWG